MNINETINSNINSSATTAIGPENMASTPIMENEHVKDLLKILKDNGRDTSGLTALLDHVVGMENFCKQAESKITDMKCQLDEMMEIQNHPIKTALQNTIKALETKVAEIKVQLSEIKTNIIEGCKNAVAAFKDKGTVVLDKLASFFKVKTCLEKVKNSSISAINECNKSIKNIETFSKQYHTGAGAGTGAGTTTGGFLPPTSIQGD